MGRTWLSMGHSSSSLGSNRHIIKISSYHHHRIYKIESNKIMPFHAMIGGSFHILLCSSGSLGSRRKVDH